MTKTETLLMNKVDKEDCKVNHEAMKDLFNIKLEGLTSLILEKIKGVTWINIGQLIGIIGILVSLVALYLKK
jgi:hypothetical protein